MALYAVVFLASVLVGFAIGRWWSLIAAVAFGVVWSRAAGSRHLHRRDDPTRGAPARS